MSFRFKRSLCLSVMATVLLTLPVSSQESASSSGSSPDSGGAMSMDLKSGRVDTRPLDGYEMQGTPQPSTPPQTVEGTLVRVETENSLMVVNVEGQGEIQVGLPENVQILRDGQESDVSALRQGDRIYATVVVPDGNRALRVVADKPVNPLVNLIGIPVLLLIALAIYWTGRGKDAKITEPAKPVKKA